MSLTGASDRCTPNSPCAAIRAWARHDALARQSVDEADGARIVYIAQLFSALGFGVAEARWRAFALYAYVVAESQIAAPIAQLQREERDRFIERLMLQPVDAQT